jgi:hypothetical protein
MPVKLTEAVENVPAYIEPRDCFVWHMSSKIGYGPIPGTPCAHYVSHQVHLKGDRSAARCKDGFLLRVEDLVRRLGDPIDPAAVQAGDVWARLHKGKRTGGGKELSSHCGLVHSVTRDPAGKTTIMIRHCSSGQRKVATDSWTKHFGDTGAFYRVPAREKSAQSDANFQRFVKGFDYRLV